MSVSSLNVAIIGAGPSGLIAAKAAKDNGLTPTIFDKSSSLGGLWRPESGSTWNNMRTNISHYCCMFSDFAHSKPCDDFPNQQQVFEYLKQYVQVYKLNPFLRLKTEVLNVSKVGDQWEVESIENGQKKKEKFGYVIIASGFFSKATQPDLKGADVFKGQVLHSQAYKNPEIFQGKTIAVIGNAFSGCEIASELVDKAKHVIHVFKEAHHVLPRYVIKDGKNTPIDFLFYSRASQARSKEQSFEQNNAKKHAWFRTISKQETLCPNELKVTTDPKDPPYVAISDHYVDAVALKKIETKKAPIDHLEERKIVFEDGMSNEVDGIIWCTGYKTKFPFLSQEILNVLEFEPDDKLQPLLLHKTVFPKTLPNMAFVGLYRGPYFGVMELQAKWACQAFSGKIPLPSQQEIEIGIAEERRIREMRPRPQFPHGDYVGLCEDLATQIGIAPDLDKIKTSDPTLYQYLFTGPFTVVSYQHDANSYSEAAREFITNINTQ